MMAYTMMPPAQTVTYQAGFTAGEFPISVKVTGGNGLEKVASTKVFVNNRIFAADGQPLRNLTRFFRSL